MNQILQHQSSLIQQINETYSQQSYSLNHPYIHLNPFGVCPLSALLKFQVDTPCTLTLKVGEDLNTTFELTPPACEIPILGLLPDSNNPITLTCTYPSGEIREFIHFIQTDALPEDYPAIQVIKSTPAQMSNGYLGLSLGLSQGVRTVKHFYSMLDAQGNVRWLYTGVACHVFAKLKNGHFIVDAPVSSGICGAYTAAGFIEMDLLGRIIEFYPIPNGLHHDVIELPNGNFLAITQREHTKQDLLVEIDRQTKAVIKEWDFRQILDFNRQTVIDKISVNHPLDWLHLNSMVYDEHSNTIIASSRNQSTVVKFDKETSEIKWILAPHEGWTSDYTQYLLTPVGDSFEWSYAQHTPVLNEAGHLLIFDNGNYRSYDLETATLAYQNYSRGVEYKIDEENMTVTQIWQYGKERGNVLYCAYLGAIRLVEKNKLLCFGGITKDIFGNPIDDMKSDRMKNRTVIVELSPDNEIVLELQMINKDITSPIGYKCYRAEKFDLYSV